MNFLELYTRCVCVEKIIETKPAQGLIVGNTVLPPIESRTKTSLYLTLELIDGHISHQAIQKSTVQETEDGLLEGCYFIERTLTLSREAFTAIFIKTFALWREAYTFYMVHGDSPGFRRFRDLVIIREERLLPITLKLGTQFQEYYKSRFSLSSEKTRITIPLISFSRPAFEFLTTENVLTIPESCGKEEIQIQEMIDTVLAKLPKWYL